MPEPLHEAVRTGRRLVGTVLTLPGVTAAELLSEPFDAVWVDLEHAALGPLDAQEMIIGAQAAGAYALVRLPADARGLMTAALDARADGVVIADVADPATAAEIVERVNHPPQGRRGWGPRRLSLRGRTEGARPVPPSVWVQIESEAGVESAAEIAAVPGIDVLCVGTADLSFALGAPLELKAAAVLDSVRVVRDACAEAGIAFGLAGGLDAAPPELLGQASILIHSTDARMCAQAVDAAASWQREVLGPEPETPAA